MEKVVLGMSGGVDSSVSAYLLKEQGYEVVGVTMALIDEKHICRAVNIEDAKAVCDQLGIEFKVLHFEDAFEEEVIQYFLEEYKRGRTPNPCVMCNKKIKFNKFLQAALELGADYIATGHYAEVGQDETGRYYLKMAEDDSKDQSYFLYNLTQDQLSKILMPLSNYKKEEVRKIADKINLNVAHKKDSEDICFIPDNDTRAFLNERLGEEFEPGNFVDTEGNILGRHLGIENYTVGQRRGLDLAMGKRVFVKEINPDTKDIVIAENDELFSSQIWIKDFNFIAFESLDEPIDVDVKIRYSKTTGRASIEPDGEFIKVTFKEAQRAPTPGQAAVFYNGDYVVGGGIIERI